MTQADKTHFGFKQVNTADKAKLVGAVFDKVASRYDLMNDVMSFGAHRLWKRFAASQSGLRAGGHALDVAGGSADMSRLLARQVGASGRVVLCDTNARMLAEGRRKMLDAGLVGRVECVRADAENLPFADAAFDCVCIAFGLRNVTQKQQALASMHRVLREGGRLLVLEFSKPRAKLLAKLYDAYSFNVLPRLGECIAGDAESYRYLVESIRRHPPARAMTQMLQQAGFSQVRVHQLAGGIVALHVGFKI